MAEENLTPDEAPPSDSSTHALILLGRVDGRLTEISGTLKTLGGAVQRHENSLTELKGSVGVLTTTVDRIKKPVETFISLRNVLVGAAALIAAIGVIFTGVPHSLWGWISSWSHPQ